MRMRLEEAQKVDGMGKFNGLVELVKWGDMGCKGKEKKGM
jgi:hypothetical protein